MDTRLHLLAWLHMLLLAATCMFAPFFTYAQMLAKPIAEEPFSDVSATSPYYESVEFLRTNHIVQGYMDGTFQPDRRMSRAEFVMLATNQFFLPSADLNCVAMNFPADRTTLHFSDVSRDDWFATSTCIAKTSDLIHGYPDGTFRPNDYISFVEAAKIVTRLFDVDARRDVSNDPLWYTVYINSLNKLGAMPSSIHGEADYSKPVTRGEIAWMFYTVKKTKMNQ